MLPLFDNYLTAVLWGGALLGFAYGAAAQWSRFCFYRGLANLWQQGNSLKLRAFLLAMAVALLSSQLLALQTGLNLTQTHYHQPSPSLPLLLVGGVLFGYGMHLANACGARSLVLLGSGNLRSLLVLLVLGVSAYATLSGLLAHLRLNLEALTQTRLPSTSIDGLISLMGVSPAFSHWITVLLISGLLAYIALKSAELRNSPRDWVGASLIGLLAAAGWWVTGVVGFDDFDPVRLASLTFVAPIGETLQFAMLSSGMPLSFAILVVTGVIVGSFLRALLAGEFSWQGYESPTQMQRGILGGMLMGIGGVLSLGCTLGQGISGFSTLALSSVPALAGIIGGTRLGLWLDTRQQE
ncbi:YeeE/YedE family protein [Nitrincola sp.]|uniref:YeeE/YedE family protein n=1 Tax=Nitrincola sp. TaxID=1926584 RepID=UPI003A909DCC